MYAHLLSTTTYGWKLIICIVRCACTGSGGVIFWVFCCKVRWFVTPMPPLPRVHTCELEGFYFWGVGLPSLVNKKKKIASVMVFRDEIGCTAFISTRAHISWTRHSYHMPCIWGFIFYIVLKIPVKMMMMMTFLPKCFLSSHHCVFFKV